MKIGHISNFFVISVGWHKQEAVHVPRQCACPVIGCTLARHYPSRSRTAMQVDIHQRPFSKTWSHQNLIASEIRCTILRSQNSLPPTQAFLQLHQVLQRGPWSDVSGTLLVDAGRTPQTCASALGAAGVRLPRGQRCSEGAAPPVGRCVPRDGGCAPCCRGWRDGTWPCRRGGCCRTQWPPAAAGSGAPPWSALCVSPSAATVWVLALRASLCCSKACNFPVEDAPARLFHSRQCIVGPPWK